MTSPRSDQLLALQHLQPQLPTCIVPNNHNDNGLQAPNPAQFLLQETPGLVGACSFVQQFLVLPVLLQPVFTPL